VNDPILEEFFSHAQKFAGLNLSVEEVASFIREAKENLALISALGGVSLSENDEPNSYLNLLSSFEKSKKK
jgi:hypothetical protein